MRLSLSPLKQDLHLCSWSKACVPTTKPWATSIIFQRGFMPQFATTWANVIRRTLLWIAWFTTRTWIAMAQDHTAAALAPAWRLLGSEGGQLNVRVRKETILWPVQYELYGLPPISSKGSHRNPLTWMQSYTELRSPLRTKKSGGPGDACVAGTAEKRGPLQAPVCAWVKLWGAAASGRPRCGVYTSQRWCRAQRCLPWFDGSRLPRLCSSLLPPGVRCHGLARSM